MIQVKYIHVESDALAFLGDWQAEVEVLPTHAARKVEADRLWTTKRKNKPFLDVIVKALDAMVAPHRRCMFCEDNSGYQVEHFWPKAIFPKLTFEWLNFLYACGQCNGKKSDRFAVYAPNGDVIEIKKSDDEPSCGFPGLLNPRHENPLDFLKLDLKPDMFEFGYIPPKGTQAYDRAYRTVEWLGLNKRGLPKWRESAYYDYRLRLQEYVKKTREGAEPNVLERLERGISRRGHLTVFREMQRQWRDVDELKEIFDERPELQAAEFPRNLEPQ
ncbi:MAG TPA: hypothetical protein PK156_46735 [Polyangium sp.]|nr:hypothetical protein [Polyangium sp.]